MTALELLIEAIVRMRQTDPDDTEAALLAAWHGFGAAEAAGQLLADIGSDDAVLQRNAAPVLAAAAAALGTAPSSPYAHPVEEVVCGLVPELPNDEAGDAVEASSIDDDRPDDAVVRSAIQATALDLNALLCVAAERATKPRDRKALEYGTVLASELSSCWEGRLHTHLNHRTNLIGSIGRQARRGSRRP